MLADFLTKAVGKCSNKRALRNLNFLCSTPRDLSSSRARTKFSGPSNPITRSILSIHIRLPSRSSAAID
ncbi:hypothetical protein PCASD_20360 [Puccinia coronata f. sp. avenae]|uniref:Uncharacterized protein n=1 Tax=Puccinia coronata f. sp. avenae TaxID=200324 RepID=A0A2N5SQC8_9BASI|nr:hypothetical protein PCASD_20360 [Puccinia coronata f. sp. avenae]